MKWLHLVPLLFVSAVAALANQVSFAPTAELGNIMYVGDSITHGVNSASYRWPLFKIWVDNGISHQEVGVNVGNWRGGVAKNTPYAGAVFRNVHSAISSERAYEIAGRVNRSGRLGNSNIHDWLGLDKSYEGTFRIDPATQMPDTFIMLIGTNDTLSDAVKVGIHTRLEETQKNLLGKARRGQYGKREGDLYTIIAAMREANPRARIAVCTMPCWTDRGGNNEKAEDFDAIVRYNEALKLWGKAHNVTVVDVNPGLLDVTRLDEKPFVAEPAMFGDSLHPNAQGDLIIAGNIAQQLGYAGRTAGLARKAASAFPQQASAFRQRTSKGGINLAAGELLIYDERGEAGEEATLELSLGKKGYGNGAPGGWNTDKPLQITLNTAAGGGTLCLCERGLFWKGRLLYSVNASNLRAPIRLAYRKADAARCIPGGFYVWLGDMLIGEALPATAACNGKRGFHLSSGLSSSLSTLSYTPSAAYAPASKRLQGAGRGKK